jgi:hypothetical protein
MIWLSTVSLAAGALQNLCVGACDLCGCGRCDRCRSSADPWRLVDCFDNGHSKRGDTDLA